MKWKIKRHSLIFKTLINMAIYSAIILFVLWIFQISFLNYFYQKYTIKTMDNAKEAVTNYKGDNLDYLLETLSYRNNICIEKISANLLQSYNTKINGCLLGRNNKDITNFERKMVAGNTSTKLQIVDPRYNTKGLLYGVNLGNTYVFMYAPLEDVNTTTSILRGQLIYITLIVLILSFVISYYISKKTIKPILNITKKTKRFAEGDFSVNFSNCGIDEIDELSETLNYARTELNKTNELKRDLLANVSHDLKTPLTMIKAYAEMVRDYSYKDDKKREENLQIIIDETDRLNLLVNDILDLSKLQANKEMLDISSFDIVEEITDILKRYEIIKKDGYIIKYQGPEKSVVKADKNKINQVIYNLINNAINYTGKDKLVIIRATEQENKVLIEIVDSGKGISKEEQKYIWDKYYKTNKNYKRSPVGSGIGLSIVKEILTYHNFSYGVTSKIKKGTTFYFYVNK